MLVHLLALCFLLPVAGFEDAHGANPLQSALDAGDECTTGSDEACAIHALQRRIGRIAAASQASEEIAQDVHPVVHLPLFRPLHHKYLNVEFSNIDMFSVQGVLHYLYAHVVWEHIGDWSGTDLQEPRMKTRAEDYDVIVGVDARVRNPDSVINEVGEIDSFMDFAAIALFIEGEATGPAYNWDYGDIVGATTPRDPAYPTIDPYYRFSLSGYCPNLKWHMKLKKHTKKTGFCMKYSDHYGLPEGEILRGGLCPNGTEPGVMPTGGPGCAYTYSPPTNDNVTKLDVLVGITEEDCGDRKCKNWKDFRAHCKNHKYKVKFNYVENNRHKHSRHTRRRRRGGHSLYEADASRGHHMQKTDYCVEYDIAKACAKNCFSEACQAIPAHKREVGLPFWKGRCDPVRNAQRAEKLAEALGVAGATETHRLVPPQDEKQFATETCLSSNLDALCRPDPSSGGMYCSRAFAGVCQPCYIPGTVEPYEHNKTTPTCPWDVLRASSDYANLHPHCSSNEPKDYCCLYTNSCNQDIIDDAMNVSLNATQDGFAYVSSLQDNDAMVAFLERAVKLTLDADASTLKGFSDFAYWKWVGRPIPDASLDQVLSQIQTHLS